MTRKQNSDGKGVLMYLPPEIDQALTADAARCRRSKKQQAIAILAAYYGVYPVNLGDMEPVRDEMGQRLARDTVGRGEYFMSLGKGTAPTKEEQELVKPDVEKALKIVAEHEAKKRKHRPK